MSLVIDWLGGSCPVQAEGRVDGEPFYFRARGRSWSLSIGGAAVVAQAWRYSEEYGTGPFDAGWMEDEVARDMINKGADIWRKERETHT